MGQMAFDALVRSAKNQKMRTGTNQHSNMGDLLREDGIVLLSTSFFKSNFVKGKVQKLNILFPEQNTPSTLEDVSGVLSGNDDSEKFFYLFYYPGDRGSIAVRDFADQLCKRFDEIDKDFQ